MCKISVIIPTLNAELSLPAIFSVLMNQSRRPDEIIVIDSTSNDGTAMLCSQFPEVRFILIKRENFDHGATRDFALRNSKGEFVLFLTQDAIPIEENYISRLIRPFEDEKVAMVYGRQIAQEKATVTERLTREFNYPLKGHVRDSGDIAKLGIKAFFASNVCSAYRKSAYLAVGGFEKHIIISEDMIISARFLNAGYKIVYQPEAAVYHSHHYTLRQQYSRNFDIGVCIAMHSDLFEDIKSENEGGKMVKFVIGNLISKGYFLQTLYYCLECAIKLLGYRRGLRYDSYKACLIQKWTMNRNFWIQYLEDDFIKKVGIK
ncbi:MAG: glycosyltransferase [Synergistaceae bacterium]|jgi:rhamnosyltransferase|nr:glycosyltransferase [Synergistaceae bacterium]